MLRPYGNIMLEVLLLEDIPGIGRINDIIVVKDGFAMNNLLPRRRAIVATPTVRKRYAEQIRKRAEERQHELEFARSAVGVIAGKTVLLQRKATKTGKLYAAITEKLIAAALKDQFSAEVAEDSIEIAEPIKSLGEHEVKITLGGSETDVKIDVKNEVAVEEEAVAA